MTLPVRLIAVALIAGVGTSAHAEVTLPPVISDHMVLQRDLAAPIWGRAAPDEAISVSIAGQTKTTKADARGSWRVDLEPLRAAEGLTLTVRGTNTLTITDVLVGEVWLGSGQSNMDGPVRTFASRDDGLQKILDGAPYPKIRLINRGGKGWQVATPANANVFSALLFAFGVRLQAELNVPVGLVQGAAGGTPSGYWLTEAMYRPDPLCQAQAKEFAATYDFDAAWKKYQEQRATWKLAEVESKKTGAKLGREPTPAARAGESPGKIGHLYEAHVRPYVPYAIRGVLWDQGESGTGITGVDQFAVMGALIRGWRADWGQNFPFLVIQKPSGGGTAWDLSDPVTKNGSPFTPLPAQVPPTKDGLAREVHLKIQQHPQTVLVPSTDLGGSTHPLNKSGYATRAARTALGFVYGKKIETSGPLYASHMIESNKVRIHFTHLGRGLAARHSDQLQGFMVAGADHIFHWAAAAIEDDSVIVSSPKVAQPIAVRYAWSGTAPWANLFNQDGLPAQTFRTDDWK